MGFSAHLEKPAGLFAQLEVFSWVNAHQKCLYPGIARVFPGTERGGPFPGRASRAASQSCFRRPVGSAKNSPAPEPARRGPERFRLPPPTTPRGNRTLPKKYSGVLHGPESPPRRSHVPGAHWGAREKIPRALTDAPWRAAFTPAALTPHTRPRRPYRPLASIRRSSGFTLARRQPPQARGAASGGWACRPARPVPSPRPLPPTHLFPDPHSPRARLHTHATSGSSVARPVLAGIVSREG